MEKPTVKVEVIKEFKDRENKESRRHIQYYLILVLQCSIYQK